MQNYYLPYTHTFYYSNKLLNCSVICPEILNLDNFTSISDHKIIESKFKPWSFKYEFVKYFNIYINSVKKSRDIYKIENQQKICFKCGEQIKDEDGLNEIYYVIETSYCFSPFIFHMMKEHNYKPPDQFIEYVLLKANTGYQFLKFDYNVLRFFKNFDNDNIFNNYKFISKKIGTVVYDDSGPKFKGDTYKNIVLSQDDKRIIQEYNMSIPSNRDTFDNSQPLYVDTEILGNIDINYNKDIFFNIKKISIVNKTFDKDIQIKNGENGIYFYSPDVFDKSKFCYHIHPDSVSSSISEKIKQRIIDGNVAFEYFSDGDFISYVYQLKDLNDSSCSFLLFTPEGIYQAIPETNLDPYKINNEMIKDLFDKEIYPYENLISSTYKYRFVDTMSTGFYTNYKKSKDYHKIIYDNNTIFEHFKTLLKKIHFDLYFYPKELKNDQEWEYGTVYMPFNYDYKEKLKKLNQPVQFVPSGDPSIIP